MAFERDFSCSACIGRAATRFENPHCFWTRLRHRASGTLLGALGDPLGDGRGIGVLDLCIPAQRAGRDVQLERALEVVAGLKQ